MSTSYKVITPPVTEPITLSDMKAWMRVSFTDEDALISSLITRARAWAESVTHRALATQQIQQVFTIERPVGGELSGPIDNGPNWYAFNEMLGANPFGPAQFFFDLAAPPVDTTQPLVIETKVTAFDPWTVFPQTTNTDGSTNTWVDNTLEPGRIYIMSPVTANFYRFTYWAGNSSNTTPIRPELLQGIIEAAAWWYENREAAAPPRDFITHMLAHRVDWL